MTKEEIKRKHQVFFTDFMGDNSDNEGYAAMDEYAKQESIAFHNWWNGYKKEVEHMVLKMPYNEERKLAAVEFGKLVNLTTDEKYSLYQQSKNKQL